MRKHAPIVVVVGIFCLAVIAGFADERIWLDAKINGKRARLCFDSGADYFILTREGAQRLGLKFTEPATNTVVPPGQVPRGITEECSLSLEGTTGSARFEVVDIPRYRQIDFVGVVGWWSLRNNIIEMDANADRITFLSKVPKRVADWIQLAVVTNGGFLILEIPHASGPHGALCIDSGSERGVDLAPDKWRAWKALHPHQPTTLNAFITLGDGLVVREEAWANELVFGPLVLTRVPVIEATPMEVALVGTNYEGDLGLAALKRLDLIVDGKRSVAYLRAKKTPPSAYSHNRLGAVFVPKDVESNEFVARVADGSPAQEAGVRNGDVLLKVNGTTITKANYDGHRRFGARAGTKINLTLGRSGEIFKTTVILRDILLPTAEQMK
jgi:hypothetical protein